MTNNDELLRDAASQAAKFIQFFIERKTFLADWPADVLAKLNTALAATAPDTAVPAQFQATDLGLDLLLRLRKALVTLGYATDDSIETFGANIETNLYDLCRGVERLATVQPAQSTEPVTKMYIRGDIVIFDSPRLTFPEGDYLLYLAAPTAQSTEPAAWMNPKEGFVKNAFIWARDPVREPQFSVPVYLAAPTTQSDEAPGHRAFDRITSIHKAAGRTLSRDDFAMMERLYDFVAAPTAQGNAGQVPGWKLVPIKITEEMHVAAVRNIIRATGNSDFPEMVWAGMLAAAPQPPAPAQDDTKDALTDSWAYQMFSDMAEHVEKWVDCNSPDASDEECAGEALRFCMTAIAAAQGEAK